MPDTTVDQPVEYPLEQINEKDATIMDLSADSVNDTSNEKDATTMSQTADSVDVTSSDVIVTTGGSVGINLVISTGIETASHNTVDAENTLDETVSLDSASTVLEASIPSDITNEKDALPNATGESSDIQRHRRSTSSGDVSLLSKAAPIEDAKEPSVDIDLKFSPEKDAIPPMPPILQIPSPTTFKKGFKRTVRRIGSVRNVYNQYKEKQSAKQASKKSQKMLKTRKSSSRHFIRVIMKALREHLLLYRKKTSSTPLTSAMSSERGGNKGAPPKSTFEGAVADFKLKYYLAKMRRVRSDAALWNRRDSMWTKMRYQWSFRNFRVETSDDDFSSYVSAQSLPGLATNDPIGKVAVAWPPPWLKFLEPKLHHQRRRQSSSHPSRESSITDDDCGDIDDNWAGRRSPGGRYDEPFGDVDVDVEVEPTESVKIVTDEDRRRIYLENAINELFETEDTYTIHLRCLAQHYFRLMRSARAIPEESLQIIARNGIELYLFHEEFKQALREARAGEDGYYRWAYTHILDIAKCLKEWAPKFEIYVEFCTGHEEALKLFQHLEGTNEDFRGSMGQLRQFQRLKYPNPRLTFEDYMHFPFQRICRYNLLITAITKGVDRSSEEYRILEEAKVLFHEVLVRVNQNKARSQAEKKTNMFLSRLETEWRLPPKWFGLLGTCTLIGTLEVRFCPERWAKRRGCALFSHYFIMVKAKQQNSYEPTQWFPMRYCEIDELPEQKARWILHYKEHTFEMSAVCATEKNLWLAAFKSSIKESQQLYLEHSADELYENLFVSSLDKRFPPAATAEQDEKLFVKVGEPSNRQSLTSSIVTFAPSATSSSNIPSVRNSIATVSNSSIDEVGQTDTNNPARSVRRLHDSMEDLRALFTNPPDALPRRPLTICSTRHKAFEARFVDVCYTPILKARTDFSTFKAVNSRRLSLMKKPAVKFKRPVSEILLPSKTTEETPLQHSHSFNVAERGSSSKPKEQTNQINQQPTLVHTETQPALAQSRSDSVLTRFASRANTVFGKKQSKGKGKEKHR